MIARSIILEKYLLMFLELEVPELPKLPDNFKINSDLNYQ